jgi:hypothetical protein
LSAAADIARQLHQAGFVVTLDLRVHAAGAAALLGCTPKTLRNQRCELRGPRWELRHGQAFYAIADLLDWIGTAPSLGAADEIDHHRDHEHNQTS